MGRGTLYALIMFFCMMALLFFVAILFATLDDNWTIAFYPLIISPLVAIFCWAMELQLDSGDERSWERSGCVIICHRSFIWIDRYRIMIREA